VARRSGAALAPTALCALSTAIDVACGVPGQTRAMRRTARVFSRRQAVPGSTGAVD
jgi:hypothetical protein